MCFRPASHRVLAGLARSLLLLAALGLAACGADRDQVALCADLLGALEPEIGRHEIVSAEAEAGPPPAVLLRYRRDGAGGHWLRCRFGGGFERARLTLIGVERSGDGALSEVQLYLLRRFWLGWFEVRVRDAGEAPPPGVGRGHGLYLLQQLVNALVPSCVYALLALGFTLIHSQVGRFHLAYGELLMAAAYAVAITLAAGAAAGAAALLALAAVGALAGTGLLSWASYRGVFRPLESSRTQAVLVATIGLAIAWREAVRLLQGSRERWLQQPFAGGWTLAKAGGFTVVLGATQVAVAAVTLVAVLAVARLLRGSRFGRGYRAAAEDPAMAALCGLDVGRLRGASFVLGGGLAALGGLIVALYYGGVHFHMGFLLGLKAVVAAVLGGIGSLGGAVLGGLLLGLFETFWSGYLAAESRGIAVFGLLALVLALRPRGLMGRRGRLQPDLEEAPGGIGGRRGP